MLELSELLLLEAVVQSDGVLKSLDFLNDFLRSSLSMLGGLECGEGGGFCGGDDGATPTVRRSPGRFSLGRRRRRRRRKSDLIS